MSDFPIPQFPFRVFLLRGRAWSGRAKEADRLLRESQAHARVSFEEIYDSLFRVSPLGLHDRIKMAAEQRWALVSYFLSRKIPIVVEEPRFSRKIALKLEELSYFHGAEFCITDFPDFRGFC